MEKNMDNEMETGVYVWGVERTKMSVLSGSTRSAPLDVVISPSRGTRI